jgi:hypothetical protein
MHALDSKVEVKHMGAGRSAAFSNEKLVQGFGTVDFVLRFVFLTDLKSEIYTFNNYYEF